MSATSTSMRHPHYLRGALLVFGGGTILSFSGLLFRATEAATDWQMMIYRSGSLAVCVFILIAVRHRARILTAFRAIGRPGLYASLLMGIGFGCYVLALNNMTVANALFLISTSPIFAGLLAWLILREMVRPAAAVACVVALLGILVMVYDGLAAGGLFGNLTAIGAAVALSGYAVAIRFRPNTDMAPALCLAAAIATAIGIGYVETTTQDGLLLTALDLKLCLFMGAQSALGFMMFTIGTRYVPAAEVLLIMLCESVFGPLSVWLHVDEVPSALSLIGGAFVLSAVAGMALSGMRRPAPVSGISPTALQAEPGWVNGLDQAMSVPGRLPEKGSMSAALEIAMQRATETPVPVRRTTPAMTPRLLTKGPSVVPHPPPHQQGSEKHKKSAGQVDGDLSARLRHGLQPMLRRWLEANLPHIVERLIREEITKMVHRVERARLEPSPVILTQFCCLATRQAARRLPKRDVAHRARETTRRMPVAGQPTGTGPFGPGRRQAP